MRIAELFVHVLEAPLERPFLWSFNRADTRGACLVEIVAEDGTAGWGECFGPPRLNAAVVEAFRPHLVGRDAETLGKAEQRTGANEVGGFLRIVAHGPQIPNVSSLCLFDLVLVGWPTQ